MAGPVRRVVTSRAGGSSRAPHDSFNLAHGVGDADEAVRANRARLAAKIGLPADHLVWMSQVHGAEVATVDEPPAAPITADALVTAMPGLALAVLVADCVPVLLADSARGVAGVAHAGRKGAAAGVVVNALDAMVALGARLGGIDVLLGPAICGRCYEVPVAMQAEVEQALPGSACPTARGTAGLDLRAGLVRQLTQRGVAGVVVDPRCTAEDATLYSYRRDGVTGRQAGLAWVV